MGIVFQRITYHRVDGLGSWGLCDLAGGYLWTILQLCSFVPYQALGVVVSWRRIRSYGGYKTSETQTFPMSEWLTPTCATNFLSPRLDLKDAKSPVVDGPFMDGSVMLA